MPTADSRLGAYLPALGELLTEQRLALLGLAAYPAPPLALPVPRSLWALPGAAQDGEVQRLIVPAHAFRALDANIVVPVDRVLPGNGDIRRHLFDAARAIVMEAVRQWKSQSDDRWLPTTRPFLWFRLTSSFRWLWPRRGRFFHVATEDGQSEVRACLYRLEARIPLKTGDPYELLKEKPDAT